MKPDQTSSFRQLGAAFAAGGDRYELLRPGYPDEAVAWMVEGTPAAGLAVDVGAGTGKLTAALLRRGLVVTAVDPSADMLEQLRRAQPAAKVQVGTGEATGLADHTADLVTFAQSWHWMEPVAGAVEIVRVLKPGGRAAWVWNFVDVREPWAGELAAIWHTLGGEDAVDRARHAPVLGADFGPVESTTVDWVQPMLLADLAALVTTRSYYLSASTEERAHIDGEVAAFLRTRFPAAETADLPYRTHCFRTRLAVPA